MATYNRAPQLEPTIQNIFKQEYQNLELIVINDGSSDNTIHVLKGLKEKYPINDLHNSTNLGLQKSLNKGIDRSKGKYIARIDDHDRWIDYHKLSKQVAFLESNPEFGIVGTGYKTDHQTFINPTNDRDIRKQILMRSPFCHVSVMMARSVVNQTEGYDESLGYSEDWDLWLKIGKCCKMANLPEIMVSTMEEDRSLSKSYFLKQLPINRRIVSKYYKDYPNSIRAFLYHQYVRVFFALFPREGKVHRFMQAVFQRKFNHSNHLIE